MLLGRPPGYGKYRDPNDRHSPAGDRGELHGSFESTAYEAKVFDGAGIDREIFGGRGAGESGIADGMNIAAPQGAPRALAGLVGEGDGGNPSCREVLCIIKYLTTGEDFIIFPGGAG